jgi:methionyl-tRNA synthetase
MKKFYITTTLPYVNSAPHIGFALEIIQADVLARMKSVDHEVIFNTGTDEHGIKIYRNALEAGMNPQAYVDENAKKFDVLKSALNLSYTNFIRTTDEHHISAAQEFWRRCAKNGDIEKRAYRVKYCVGCELEKTDSELVDGKCPIHPNISIELIEEENYFFKFSRYQEKLLTLYAERADFVVPSFRLHEIKNFVASGLSDFSISRLKEKMPWGIPVPDDDDHVMYVWFDALVNYISTLGWPDEKKGFSDFWPGFQVAGKDNLRQQSAMWPAMLFSAGIMPPAQVFIHGFITSEGQKMSKSLGNIVDPLALVAEYGTDAVRYYLLREIPAYEDGDFSLEKFRARYNGDLANGLGNFAARVITLAGDFVFDEKNTEEKEIMDAIEKTRSDVMLRMKDFRFNEALASAWELISFGDEYANRLAPWKIKDIEEKKRVVGQLLTILESAGKIIAPFLPGTAEKISSAFIREDGVLKLKKIESLFPRLG